MAIPGGHHYLKGPTPEPVDRERLLEVALEVVGCGSFYDELQQLDPPESDQLLSPRGDKPRAPARAARSERTIYLIERDGELLTRESMGTVPQKRARGDLLRADGWRVWFDGPLVHRDGEPAIILPDGERCWVRFGLYHREGGPAIDSPEGEIYLQHGVIHRTDGPAFLTSTKRAWMANEALHREDGGPAVEHVSGTKEWWVMGRRHREDGPAVEQADGTREWWRDGRLHREDGPAIEHPTDRSRERWADRGQIWRREPAVWPPADPARGFRYSVGTDWASPTYTSRED